MFRQNGPSANTGALFLAYASIHYASLPAVLAYLTFHVSSVSQEENLEQHHTISPNGYDIGRDMLVSAATSGQTSFRGVLYQSTMQEITGLLPAGSQGINHGMLTLSKFGHVFDIRPRDQHRWCCEIADGDNCVTTWRICDIKPGYDYPYDHLDSIAYFFREHCAYKHIRFSFDE